MPASRQLYSRGRKAQQNRHSQPRVEIVKKNACGACQRESSEEQRGDDTMPAKPNPHLPLRHAQRGAVICGCIGLFMDDQFGTSNQPRVH